MFPKLLAVCLFVSMANAVAKYHHYNKSRFSAGVLFYDLATNRTILPPYVSQAEGRLRNPFGRRCDCKLTDNRMVNKCSCCAGVKLTRLGFQRELCTRLQYNLSKRNQMLMDVTMNGRPIAQNNYNLRAPDIQPLCVPLPIPIIPVSLDFCIKIFEVEFNGPNVHMCMDWSARIEKAPVILLHFDCIEMGANGVSLLKPGQKPDQITGQFPSVIDSGSFPPIVSPELGGGSIINPTDGIDSSPVTNPQPGTSPVIDPSPVNPSPPIINPAIPDDGNLPQVGATGGDFDQVDDLKLKEKNPINRG